MTSWYIHRPNCWAISICRAVSHNDCFVAHCQPLTVRFARQRNERTCSSHAIESLFREGASRSGISPQLQTAGPQHRLGSRNYSPCLVKVSPARSIATTKEGSNITPRFVHLKIRAHATRSAHRTAQSMVSKPPCFFFVDAPVLALAATTLALAAAGFFLATASGPPASAE